MQQRREARAAGDFKDVIIRPAGRNQAENFFARGHSRNSLVAARPRESGWLKLAILVAMDLAGWEQRYRAQEETAEASPHRLVLEAARSLPPGRALDLACGTGRNALWLAQHGWSVTAVDGSPAAIEILRQRAGGLPIAAQIADLENGAFTIEPARYDLIAICYYLE